MSSLNLMENWDYDDWLTEPDEPGDSCDDDNEHRQALTAAERNPSMLPR